MRMLSAFRVEVNKLRRYPQGLECSHDFRCHELSCCVTRAASIGFVSKAKLEMMRADGNGDLIKYFELENVLIEHIAPAVRRAVARQALAAPSQRPPR